MSYVMTDKDLGCFLVDTVFVTGKFSLNEGAKSYLDYAKIGAEQRNILGGIHTQHDFVKHQEESPVQSETPRTLTLAATERSDDMTMEGM